MSISLIIWFLNHSKIGVLQGQDQIFKGSKVKKFDINSIKKTKDNFNKHLLKLLSHPNITSKNTFIINMIPHEEQIQLLDLGDSAFVHKKES